MKSNIKEIVDILKKDKKKLILVICIISVLFISTFTYINMTNPTRLNKYLAEVINTPANPAFDDQKFYNLVISDYNRENSTSLPYTANLTDEQLATIKEVSTHGASVKVTSLNGIEKLISLSTLELSGSSLTEIDLSSNTKLWRLLLHDEGISSIDLSQNVYLEDLSLYETNLTKIDLSHNAALKRLFIYRNNNLNSIDLSQNTNLAYLNLSNNNLSTIDLSHNTALTSLNLGSNNLSAIDLSHNTALGELFLSVNNLSTIDLSQNTNLAYLTLSNNNLSAVDLSNNTNLTYLYALRNNLSFIDLTHNTNLTNLYLSYNNLTSIDLSHNTALTSLDLGYNNLSAIDLSQNTKLTSVNLSGNNNLSETKYLKVNEKYTYEKVKLPDDKYQNVINSNSEVISFNKGEVTALKPGDATLNYFGAQLIVKVYGITSSKYTINENKKTIYTKTDTNEEEILTNIESINASIKIENNKVVLYNGEEELESYKIINATSSNYDLTKDYIYLGSGELDTGKLTIVNGNISVDNNKLIIKDEEEIVKEYDLVRITSEKYDLEKEYIYDNNFNEDNITYINCTSDIVDNKLNIKYGNEVLDTKDIVKVETIDYVIKDEYINIGTEELDQSKIIVTNADKLIRDDLMVIKYNGEILDEYNIVGYKSSYNLEKEYIYDNNFNKDNIICINCYTEVVDNKLNIKYGNDILRSYDIVKIESEVFDIEKEEIRVDSVEELEEIKVVNLEKEYIDNKLYIKYNDEVIKEYSVVVRLLGDITDDDNIDIEDVIKLYSYYMLKDNLTESQKKRADVNKDGVISISDISKIYAYYKGKINEF